jgi:hypothetical protein
MEERLSFTAAVFITIMDLLAPERMIVQKKEE